MKAVGALIFLALMSVAGQAQEKPYKEIKTTYDRFTDHTTFETGLMRLWGTTNDHLEVSFGAVYSGPKDNKIVIMAIFKQILKDTALIEAKQIYVIADGQRLAFDDIQRLILKKPIENLSIYRHEFSAGNSVETALKVAKAKSVEVKVGHLEVKLLPEHLDIFDNLLRKAASVMK